MQRYDTYKDSGVKWLGEIPSHWEVNKAKYYLYSKKAIVGKDSANHERLALTLNGVIKRQDGDDIGLNPEKLDTYQIVESGNLIFKLIDLENFKTSRVGLTPYNGIVSPAYIRLINKGDVNMRFLEYYYLSMWHRKVFNDLGAPGVRSNLSANDLLNLCIVLPNVNEQDAIVSYLDTATAKIDAAIAQQQKMIDFLNERKQIIINRAVTKGLNPNAKMKDSGVEWIGEVPEHWDVMRMRYLCSITTGNKDTINRVDDGLYPFYVRSPKVERINTYSYDGEAVLMAGDGVGAGKVFHYVNGKFDYHQRVYNFYNIKKIKAKLLYYYMKSHFRYVIEQLSAKSTVDSVRLNMIQDFLVVIPPMQEQLDLIEYLDSQMKNLDDSISMFENQISLLQERKQIIINEVVTGKVKIVNN